jgi:hypothetical protein
MKIKIISADNNLLWYSKYIDYEFDVVRRENNALWVNEPDPRYSLINWVYLKDCQIIEE